MKAIVPLAPGFEEIEAVTIIDVLRRAGIETVSASIGTDQVKGAHSIIIQADTTFDRINADEFSAIILPGGMPGSKNLMNNTAVIEFIRTIYNNGGYACAVCAAPIVLAKAGIIEGKRATCYPGYESYLKGAILLDEPVVIDGKVITGKGPGCAIPFALTIAGAVKTREVMMSLKEDMQVYWF